ncbi:MULTISPECIES: LysR family transcriptional regulator [unclassified Shewanella]|uniref:LysR family transcriptional regulator n=1 Tax=unclassified Shewanella TaxID=196818 RepID=UPI000C85B907|nr:MULTISPECIES: LysR family transcriptional regulator [unclassified Shewanella]MDO6620750.1 LysR family transcriptional regulator [Shewanella sp. 6_MG-2023]MDO6641289.1 LysR family transcriptional regulator [Shewanella sp. 5_MG-2023]MDO6775389.1 LysR family transcriptional regulator [Shewanella sp. 3_MG-2023]PMG30415.1 LysR family transcriptional regulator [Shewanella sp. 10N.286.52.C2]PMG51483.1 LysR family transcriptional regulator [Shewanella sp. 10N.286.52.B9]
MQINDLHLFVRVADCGSIGAAAVELDISAAAASAALKRLEKQLNSVLFIRTTRSLRLTAEGEHYLIHCREALAQLQLGQQALLTEKGQISGQLNISVSSDFGRNVFLPWLDSFLLQYPDLTIQLHIGDSLSHFQHDKIDMALRYGIPPDSSQVAFNICHTQRVLCASSAYIQHHGEPKSPAELAQHNCLIYKVDERNYDLWTLINEQQSFKIRVSGDRSSNDADVTRRWAVSGQGIVFKSALDVVDDLNSGRLQQILPGFTSEAMPLNLICAGRQHVSPAMLLMRDKLRQHCLQLQQAVAI